MPIDVRPRYNWNIVESGVKHDNPNRTDVAVNLFFHNFFERIYVKKNVIKRGDCSFC